MGSALSILVLMSLSVFVVRLASVALRLTGLPEATARFQALSAFTGTGFTTTEAETVVNYPVRRRIVSLMMIIGNMGLITVFAALVVSLVNTEGEVTAVVTQIVWLVAGLLVLWAFMLNKTADRFLCALIDRVLRATTLLGKRHYVRLLQTGEGYSVCEHPVQRDEHRQTPDALELKRLGLTVLAVRSTDGTVMTESDCIDASRSGDVVVVFGSDAGHEELARSHSCPKS